MFYTMHIRIGNEIRIGYFFLSFKRPYWIGSKVIGYINPPKRFTFVSKGRETGDSRDDAWVI